MVDAGNKNQADSASPMHRPTWKGFFVAIGVALAGVVVLFVVAAAVMFWWFEIDFEAAADFGNSFGGISALFSALALAAVAGTLIQGQRQLQIQQIELVKNTAMLRAQRNELREQNRFHARREVQTTFFDLLRTLESTISHMSVPAGRFIGRMIVEGPMSDAHGRNAFNWWARELSREIGVPKEDTPAAKLMEDTRTAYGAFYRNHSGELGHYFRLMYHIVGFVDRDSVLADEEKKFLIRILRAHLSQPESYLLFYNCLSEHGYEKFHPLVEEYDLLQNFDPDSVPESHWQFYPKSRERMHTAML